METSARSVLRSAKERFNISKYRYFLFSAESVKGVIVLKEYSEGLFTNSFPPLLPVVITTGIPVDPGMPDRISEVHNSVHSSIKFRNIRQSYLI